jgi:hypothetical protein
VDLQAAKKSWVLKISNLSIMARPGGRGPAGSKKIMGFKNIEFVYYK